MYHSINGTVIDKYKEFTIFKSKDISYKLKTSIDVSGKVIEVYLYKFNSKFEDTATYYGFKSKDELAMFEQLIGKPGIGPTSAFAILSSCKLQTINEAMDTGNYLLLKDSKVNDSILRKVVAKSIRKNSDIKSLQKVLKDFGYDKDAIDDVILGIYDQELEYESMLKKMVLRLNDNITR